jgi:DNA repair protein RecO (recombination protein O)
MSDRIKVRGMVLSASPIGENDRRLLLLTKELGLISAFCRGAQKQKSSMAAGSRPFTAGRLEMYAGRSSYTVVGMEVLNYFDSLSRDPEAAAYGMFFMEFSAYYGREGIDGTDQLNLNYLTLAALEKRTLPFRLIASVFVLKTMVISGEYSEQPLVQTGAMAENAWRYVVRAPLGKLYSFELDSASEKELEAAVQKLMEHYVDRQFKSLAVLEEMRSTLPISEA